MRIRTYQEISGDDSLTFEEKIDRIEDAVARRQGEEAASVYREAVDRCIAWSEEPKRFELKQIADAWEATMPLIREAWRSESYGLCNFRGFGKFKSLLDRPDPLGEEDERVICKAAEIGVSPAALVWLLEEHAGKHQLESCEAKLSELPIWKGRRNWVRRICEHVESTGNPDGSTNRRNRFEGQVETAMARAREKGRDFTFLEMAGLLVSLNALHGSSDWSDLLELIYGK